MGLPCVVFVMTALNLSPYASVSSFSVGPASRRNCWIQGKGHLQLLVHCQVALQSRCARVRPTGGVGERQLLAGLQTPDILSLTFCQADGWEGVSWWFKMFASPFTNKARHLFLCLWGRGRVIFNPGTQGTVFPGLRVRMAVWLLSENRERAGTQGKTGRTEGQIQSGRAGMEARGRENVTRRWKWTVRRLQTRSETVHSRGAESASGPPSCAVLASLFRARRARFAEPQSALLNVCPFAGPLPWRAAARLDFGSFPVHPVAFWRSFRKAVCFSGNGAAGNCTRAFISPGRRPWNGRAVPRMRLAAAFLGVAKWAPTRLHGVELFWCVAPVALIPEPPAAGQGVGSSGVGLRHLGFLFFVSATADFDKPLKLRIHRVRRAARQGQGARHRHICASCSTKDYRRREWGSVCSEPEWRVAVPGGSARHMSLSTGITWGPC